jgi:hypothetical protein
MQAVIDLWRERFLCWKLATCNRQAPHYGEYVAKLARLKGGVRY